MSNFFTLGVLDLDGTKIPVHDVSLNPGIQKFMNGAGSRDVATFLGTMTQEPVITCKTYAVAAAITALSSALFATISSAAYLKLFKGAHGAVAASGSVNHTVTVNHGVVVIDSIAGRRNNAAELTLGIHASWDGTNNPLVVADNVASEDEGDITTHFVGHELTLGGTDYEFASFNVQPNIELFKHVVSGDPYPDTIGIQKQRPVISVSSEDMALHAAVGTLGGAKTSTVLGIRACTRNGTRTALTSTAHVTVTIASGFANVTDVSASWREYGAIGVDIEAYDDDSNAPMALATGAALEVA